VIFAFGGRWNGRRIGLGAAKEVKGSAKRPPSGRRCAPSFFVVAEATTHKDFLVLRAAGGRRGNEINHANNFVGG
jgi:hypothetical protein